LTDRRPRPLSPPDSPAREIGRGEVKSLRRSWRKPWSNLHSQGVEIRRGGYPCGRLAMHAVPDDCTATLGEWSGGTKSASATFRRDRGRAFFMCCREIREGGMQGCADLASVSGSRARQPSQSHASALPRFTGDRRGSSRAKQARRTIGHGFDRRGQRRSSINTRG